MDGQGGWLPVVLNGMMTFKATAHRRFTRVAGRHGFSRGKSVPLTPERIRKVGLQLFRNGTPAAPVVLRTLRWRNVTSP